MIRSENAIVHPNAGNRVATANRAARISVPTREGARRPFEDARAASDMARRFGLEDPLDADVPSDRAMAISLRRIGRVATVAAEVGARFARERIAVDPVAWLSAPRRLFGGSPAIVAVQNPEHFRRAMLLHGLSLGFDADPSEIDDLMDDDDADVVISTDAMRADDHGGEEAPGLFTAVVVDVSERGSVYVFHARVASSRADFETGLRLRLGSAMAESATIDLGYDTSDPIASALVSEALEDMLVQIADDPASPLARGLDVLIEQRFAD